MAVTLLAFVLIALELCAVTALRIPDVPPRHVSARRAPLQHSTSPNLRTSIKKLVQKDKIKEAAARDRARAKALVKSVTSPPAKFDKNSGQPVGVAIANIVTTYIAAVDVGSPPTEFFLIVDTGSSNTWVGATTPFTQTSTTTFTGDEVFVQYGSGFFFGEEAIDTVDFGGPLVIPQQSIGTADFSDGFQGVDGIVGIGPTGLTSGTVDNEGTIPTVTDNLFALGIIPDPVVSVFFAPTNDTFDVNGELVFGGIDPGAFTGDLTVFPLTTTFPSSEFFGVDASFVQSGVTILDSAGIVDTGTTLVLLADDAFQTYIDAIGAGFDPNVGLFTVTPDQFATLPTLEVVLGGVTFPLTPDAQRLPAQLVPAFGGDPSLVYLIVSNIGSDSGSGFDFVLGQFFLERFYSVFDSRGGGAVAFAPTVFTDAVVNN